MTLHIREGHYGLYLSLAYSTELFLPATIAGMMRHFENLLEAIAADPDARIGALPMLEPEERSLRKVSEQAVRPANPYDLLCPRGDRAIDCGSLCQAGAESS